jgi:hypothetical protein
MHDAMIMQKEKDQTNLIGVFPGPSSLMHVKCIHELFSLLCANHYCYATLL